MCGDWLGRNAQIRALVALTAGAAFTAITVAVALLAGFAVLVACRARAVVIHGRWLVYWCLTGCVVAVRKAQLGLASFTTCTARFTVRTGATAAAATASTAAFARLARFTG